MWIVTPMHELAVTEQILKIALRHAEAAGATRITDLRIVAGQLSSMVDDSVQFYWDTISAGTIAQGAQLHFRRIPAEAECDECGSRYQLNRDDFACPVCGSQQMRLVSGEEFYVESIDVETAEGATT